MKRSLLASLLYILPVITFLYSCKQEEKDDKPRRLEILFLGHKSEHHNSEKLAEILSQEYFKDGINISYTVNPDDLLRSDLKSYDGLILYANHDSITKPQADALLDYVKSGKGFITLHCASWCFRNSPEVVELIGGQFKTHKYDSFPAVIVKPNHPVMKDVPAFSTMDETYVHDKLSKNIEVLTERVEGNHHEPYTWVRPYGDGRVFYTAYGHDEKTWMNPGFLKLVHNGIMWAVGDKAKALVDAYPKPQPVYKDAKMPNYEKRDPPPKYQLPLTPEQSMQLTQIPVGFEIKLFASEPDIHKPIYMNWDERGRLWIVETVDYPNMVRENKAEGRDMIKILEDTDGDGKADKFTVFADKLNIPTSFAFINGGVVVAQAPDFLFLKDTNGDDKADVREKIITGWGTFDTHAGPSNFKYGPDNTIWGTVGYSGFKGVVGDNKMDTMRFSQGLYHFTADGKQLEFLGATSNNTWGLGFSEDYDAFISTANNTHSAAYTIPKRYFDIASQGSETGIEKIESHYGMHVVTKNLRQVDVHGGFTAAAGHNLYTARNYPKEYWNRIALVCEPTGRVVHKNVIEPNGSSFKEGGDGWNLVASADEWFGPIQAEVGPDGDVWVLDWYNFIIQHNPTPEGYETGKGNAHVNALRDDDKGRIYRLHYKKSPIEKIHALSKDDPDGLIKALSSNNMFWRTTAQRLLVESGNKKAADKLYGLIKNTDLDEIGLNAPAVHALWTLQGLKAFNAQNKEALDVAVAALKHPAAGVRRAAIQVLPNTEAVTQALIDAGVFEDKDLRVVLAAVLKTSDLPTSDLLGQTLFKLATKEGGAAEDKWIQKALYIAASVQQHSGFEKSYKASGINENVELGKAALVHRIMMRSTLNVLPLNNGINPGMLPDLTGREIFVTARVEQNKETRPTGLILAQGNMENGYAVYIGKDKHLYYQVNQDKGSSVIQSTDSVPDKFMFSAKLLRGGTMQLYIDGKEAATGKTKGLFGLPLRDAGLRLGSDYWNSGAKKAGNYPDSTRGIGKITEARMESLLVETERPQLGKPDQVIVLKTIQHEMKYDQQKLTVKAGTIVEIVFTNVDFMQHNLLILAPGSMQRVGEAADKLAQTPDGANVQYVPATPDVLYNTPLVNPDQKFSLKFRVPDVPGDYPYICSYPGHWRIMNGVLIVVGK